jgi:probable F420-dependent oxidoreductase
MPHRDPHGRPAAKEDAVKFSVNIPHTGPLATPSAIRDTAQAAEDLGYDAIMVVDHLALQPQVASQYDLGPEPVGIPDGNLRKTLSPLYECLSTLSFLAGATRRVRLGTGICVLPLRNPLYNARQIASIDALSGGRVDLGIGAGWLREEAEALQMPWEERGARTDEHIRLMRALWESKQDYVSFQGKYYRFDDVDPQPQPAQKPLPIYVGGHTPAAKRRAGQLGDGWITSQLDPAVQKAGMEEVRAAARAAGRDPNHLQWCASVDPRWDKGEVKRPAELKARIAAYAELGIGKLHFVCHARSLEDYTRLMQWLAKEVMPEFRGK